MTASTPAPIGSAWDTAIAGPDAALPQHLAEWTDGSACHPALAAANVQTLSGPSVLEALAADRLSTYVCDFPSASTLGHPRIIALPHLGASTREAEENCAVMVVDQLRDYLEHGNIRNAVNFPDVVMERESQYRVGIANSNVPNMLGQISTAMADAGLNIHNMLNKSKGEMAYTLVDVDSEVPAAVIDRIAAIKGVLAVRSLPLRTA